MVKFEINNDIIKTFEAVGTPDVIGAELMTMVHFYYLKTYETNKEIAEGIKKAWEAVIKEDFLFTVDEEKKSQKDKNIDILADILTDWLIKQRDLKHKDDD
jgi:hypothetical protein